MSAELSCYHHSQGVNAQDIPDPFSFSACTNISWTCLMFGIRSGADLNSPGMFFDLNPSADFSSAFKPLLNFLKDYATVFINCAMYRTPCELTLRACKKSLTLQFLAWIRETIRSRSGRPLTSAVKSSSNAGLFIKSSTASSLCRASQNVQGRSRQRTIPRSDVFRLAKGHAKPYPEQALPYCVIIRKVHPGAANKRT